jgi:hypothetical protein
MGIFAGGLCQDFDESFFVLQKSFSGFLSVRIHVCLASKHWRSSSSRGRPLSEDRNGSELTEHPGFRRHLRRASLINFNSFRGKEGIENGYAMIE